VLTTQHPISAKKKTRKLALTSLKSGRHSVGIVRSRPQATKFSFFSLVHSALLKQFFQLAKELNILMESEGFITVFITAGVFTLS
jgi:hypothetical protein